MQDVVQFDDRKAYGRITLEVFPGASESSLYEDDGISEDYMKKGAFAETKMISSHNGVTIGKAVGSFKVPERTYALKIHSDKKPERVTVTKNSKKLKVMEGDGEELNGWNYNEEEGLLRVYVSKKAEEEIILNY